MARSFHSHWLVGASTSVLREDFVSSYHHGDSLVGAEPFSGRIMLPTKLQALKLHFFLKDEAGRKNSTVTPGEITGYVAEVIKHYWVLAGYETVASPKNKIAKLLKDYQFQHKNRNKKHKKGLEDRSKFEEDLNKLLDIAHPNLEKILSEDRTRGNLVGRKSEDLKFLQDQRGERKMTMGRFDEEFSKKKAAQLKRKLGSASSSTITSQDILSEDQNESFGESSPIKDNRDEEFNIQENKDRRSDFITVELPRDSMASLDITSALDRTNIPNRTAMQIVSSVLKTAKKDGQQVDLNEFVLSRDTIGRRRQENRDTISKQAKQEFLDNMPARMSLHWDGKMLQDLSGELMEMEAIIVCGENYPEGKLLGKQNKLIISQHYYKLLIQGIVDLQDEDGQTTSTGFAQAEAVHKKVVEWGTENKVVCLMFDTTASNSGHLRGAAIRLQSLLKRPLIFCGCRHHVGELFGKNTWHKIFGKDPAPDVKIFVNIKKVWPSVDTAADIKLVNIPDDKGRKELVDL